MYTPPDLRIPPELSLAGLNVKLSTPQLSLEAQLRPHEALVVALNLIESAALDLSDRTGNRRACRNPKTRRT